MSFAKCSATLTKCRPTTEKIKKVSLPSKVLKINTNKSNESVHFYHRGSKTGPWLKYLDADSRQASTTAAVNSAMYCQMCRGVKNRLKCSAKMCSWWLYFIADQINKHPWNLETWMSVWQWRGFRWEWHWCWGCKRHGQRCWRTPNWNFD